MSDDLGKRILQRATRSGDKESARERLFAHLYTRYELVLRAGVPPESVQDRMAWDRYATDEEKREMLQHPLTPDAAEAQCRALDLMIALSNQPPTDDKETTRTLIWKILHKHG